MKGHLNYVKKTYKERLARIFFRPTSDQTTFGTRGRTTKVVSHDFRDDDSLGQKVVTRVTIFYTLELPWAGAEISLRSKVGPDGVHPRSRGGSGEKSIFGSDTPTGPQDPPGRDHRPPRPHHRPQTAKGARRPRLRRPDPGSSPGRGQSSSARPPDPPRPDPRYCRRAPPTFCTMRKTVTRVTIFYTLELPLQDA